MLNGQPCISAISWNVIPWYSFRTIAVRCSSGNSFITSATIDADRFARHFGTEDKPVPVIEVSGRLYPVEIRYRPVDSADIDGGRGELTLQTSGEVKGAARAAAKNVQAQRTIFGKRVAGHVRLGEQAQTRDAAGTGELVPSGLADRVQCQLFGEPRKQRPHFFEIRQRRRITPVRFDHPLAAAHHPGDTPANSG